MISHRDKLACMATIGAFVAASGASASQHIAIEQCLDEMITNALYNAPTGTQGERIFASVKPRDRTSMRTQYAVSVAYAFDGKRLGIAVRDVFGSLKRITVLRGLGRGIHAQDKVE